MRIRDDIYIRLLTNERTKWGQSLTKARYYTSQEEDTIYSRCFFSYCAHFLYLHSSRSPYLVFTLYTIENPTYEIIGIIIGYFSHDYAVDGKPFGFLTRSSSNKLNLANK